MLLGLWVTVAHATSEVVAPAVAAAGNGGLLQMVLHAGPMVRAIMLGLLALSVICWAIIASKVRLMRKMKRESERFRELYRRRGSTKALCLDCEDMGQSHLAHLFRSGFGELLRMGVSLEAARFQRPRVSPRLVLESVDDVMQSEVMTERERMERFLPFLATTGSTAPFIGLFGTVWGIMNSFQDIGLKGSANLAVVAPGISEALVATAMGLAAAIPAVVAYNHFSNQIRKLENEMLHFITEFLNGLKRDLLNMPKRDEPVQAISAVAEA